MRKSDGPEIVYTIFGMAILAFDVFYVIRVPQPDKWIILGMTAIGAGVLSRKFMSDLVQIARAKFRAPDA